MNRNNFIQIVKEWQYHKEHFTPTFYLVLLSNNEIIIQTDLYENKNLPIPNFPSYILKGLTYAQSYLTNPDLDLLYDFVNTCQPKEIFNLINNKPPLFFEGVAFTMEQKHSGILFSNRKKYINENDFSFEMSLENFKIMLEEWQSLEEKNCPEIYFIQKDDGTIIVRESLEK